MRKAITLIIVGLMLSGCGEGFEAINTGKVDPEFEDYVNKFLEIYEIPVIHVDMYFDEQSGNVIGVCKIRGNDRYIEIDPNWWSWSGDVDREILIFHELGHCVLDQHGHRDFRLTDGCPGSIMDTYHIGANCYEKHYDYYIEEMRVH